MIDVLCAGVPKSMHMHVKREVPNMNKMMPSVNVEQIAAEVEKLLGQKTGVPAPTSMNSSFSMPPSSGQPTSQNAITSFLNSVVQLQNAVPGINVMQLLQAVGAPQEQGPVNNGPHGMPHGMPQNAAAQMDLKAALAHAQLQLNLQNQVQNMQVSFPPASYVSTLSMHLLRTCELSVPNLVQIGCFENGTSCRDRHKHRWLASLCATPAGQATAQCRAQCPWRMCPTQVPFPAR